ncbi:MAG: BLUF domain-containing protein [Paracoccaceae bacterium]
MDSNGDIGGCGLVTFAYVSDARPGLSPFEIGQIVRQAWSNNLAHEISGLLIFSDGRFQEVIEGPHEHVLRLVARIVADGRHNNIEVKRFERIAERTFDGWKIVGFSSSIDNVPQDARARSEDADKVVPIYFRRA